MKKKNLITALVLTIAVGAGVTSYAASNTISNTNTLGNKNVAHQRLQLGRTIGARGYDSVTSVLKNKLKATDEEITNAINSGKSMFDLAKEKGLSEEDFKTAIKADRIRLIDEAIANGKLSKEQGDAIKTSLEANMENCTGSFGQMKKGNENCGGSGCGGRMGNSRGAGNNINCPVNNTTGK